MEFEKLKRFFWEICRNIDEFINNEDISSIKENIEDYKETLPPLLLKENYNNFPFILWKLLSNIRFSDNFKLIFSKFMTQIKNNEDYRELIKIINNNFNINETKIRVYIKNLLITLFISFLFFYEPKNEILIDLFSYFIKNLRSHLIYAVNILIDTTLNLSQLESFFIEKFFFEINKDNSFTVSVTLIGDLHSVSREIDTFINSLLLCKLGFSHFEIHARTISIPNLNADIAFIEPDTRFFDGVSKINPTNELDSMKLIRGFKKILKLTKQNQDQIRISFDKFQNALREVQIHTQITNAVSSLEALYVEEGGTGEAKRKLCQRTALLLSLAIPDFESEIINKYKLLVVAYDIRSRDVHGEKVKSLVKGIKLNNFLVYEIFEISRISILLFLELLENKEIEEYIRKMLNIKDERKITFEDIRKILDITLLDLNKRKELKEKIQKIDLNPYL